MRSNTSSAHTGANFLEFMPKITRWEERGFVTDVRASGFLPLVLLLQVGKVNALVTGGAVYYLFDTRGGDQKIYSAIFLRGRGKFDSRLTHAEQPP